MTGNTNLADEKIKTLNTVETPSSGITNAPLWVYGKVAVLRFRGCTATSGNIGTIPQAYCPKDSVNTFVRVTETSGGKYQVGLVSISDAGQVSVSKFIPDTTTVVGGVNGVVAGEITYMLN